MARSKTFAEKGLGFEGESSRRAVGDDCVMFLARAAQNKKRPESVDPSLLAVRGRHNSLARAEAIPLLQFVAGAVLAFTFLVSSALFHCNAHAARRLWRFVVLRSGRTS